MSIDRTLICKNCGKEFAFTAREQEFFASKGFSNDPTKCKECRNAIKQLKIEQQNEIICKACGKKDTVGFKPNNPNDILCDECYQQKRQNMITSQPAAKEEATE
jgi:CxxC-x17-CxxC domain-containing protein